MVAPASNASCVLSICSSNVCGFAFFEGAVIAMRSRLSSADGAGGHALSFVYIANIFMRSKYFTRS